MTGSEYEQTPPPQPQPAAPPEKLEKGDSSGEQR